MRKIILMLITFVCISTTLAYSTEQKQPEKQEGTSKEKKKKKKNHSGTKLKKRVESTTALDVSDETLFVYPQIAKWKMTLKSAIANLKTGELIVIFGIMPLDGQTSAYVAITEVLGGNNQISAKRTSYRPDESRANTWKYTAIQNYNSVTLGLYTDFKLNSIYVEDGAKSLKQIKFVTAQADFEARDIPITWAE